MAGISSLQGGHQVAQKLRNTTWPRKSDSFPEPPSGAEVSKPFVCCTRWSLMRSSAFTGFCAPTGPPSETTARRARTRIAATARPDLTAEYRGAPGGPRRAPPPPPGRGGAAAPVHPEPPPPPPAEAAEGVRLAASRITER